MSGKKRWIVLLGLAAAGFGVSFALSVFLVGSGETPTSQNASLTGGLVPPDAAGAKASTPVGLAAISPKAGELAGLIKEVRHKIAACQDKERKLQEQEKRIRLAQEMLDTQAEELEKLRMELVAPLARLKEIQDQIRQSRLSVSKRELVNLKRIAAIYDKKDSVAAAETMTAMCANGQEADAVKILFFMTERTAGKVLAEMSDRKLVAQLYDKMKRIEQEG